MALPGDIGSGGAEGGGVGGINGRHVLVVAGHVAALKVVPQVLLRHIQLQADPKGCPLDGRGISLW